MNTTYLKKLVNDYHIMVSFLFYHFLLLLLFMYLYNFVSTYTWRYLKNFALKWLFLTLITKTIKFDIGECFDFIDNHLVMFLGACFRKFSFDFINFWCF